MTRKVLISTGFGAGWSTWNDGGAVDDFLFDPILIASIEKDGLTPEAIAEFSDRMEIKYGEQSVCILGADGLRVVKVSGPFIVDEYDGSETIMEKDDVTWH